MYCILGEYVTTIPRIDTAELWIEVILLKQIVGNDRLSNKSIYHKIMMVMVGNLG